MQLLQCQPLILCSILSLGSAAGQAPPVPGLMASPMAAPAGVEEPIPSVRIQFDILNLDYEAVAENDEARDGIRDAVHGVMNHIAEDVFAGGPAGPPVPAEPAALPPGAPAFIELSNSSGHKLFDKKAPRSALSHSSRHSSNALQPVAPAPAPMAAPAMPDNVDTFVALEEGPKDVTEVNVWTVDPVDRGKVPGAPSPAPMAFIDRGSNALFGKPGMATPGLGTKLKEEMKDVCKNPSVLANALLGAEGVKWKHAPAIGNCKVTIEPIQSFHLDCGPHIKKIISRFSVAYTRAQVPHALEEACHLFESKVSFSGNRRITKWDKRVCKKATEKLMGEWQPKIPLLGAKLRNGDWGANSTGGKAPMNYNGWCEDLCEWKFGKGAPQCRI